MSVAPGATRPWRSASSRMANAMRSLTLPPGFRNSHLPRTGTGSRAASSSPPAARAEGQARAPSQSTQRSLKKMDFGKTADGTPITLYTLSNGRLTAKVMTYGAIVTEIHAPDRDGKPGDVVLGFETL